MNLRKNEIGANGGASIAEAMELNHTLKVLNLSDNSVGNGVITLISGRISGNVLDVSNSVCMKELVIPLRYEEGRYDHIELKRLMRLKEESTRRRLQKSVLHIKAFPPSSISSAFCEEKVINDKAICDTPDTDDGQDGTAVNPERSAIAGDE